MLKEEMNRKSPMRLLEARLRGGLDRGDLGVFFSGRGAGKTACLIHVAIDSLLLSKRVLHLSFYDKPDHVLSWYEDIFRGLAKACSLESASDVHDEIAQYRLILNFKAGDRDLKGVCAKIRSMLKDIGFVPDVVIIDGYDFESGGPESVREFKALVKELNAEGWFSLSLKDEDMKVQSSGLPGDIRSLLPLISTAVRLETLEKAILLKILLEHGKEVEDDSHLRLSPSTFLMEEG